MIKLSEEGVSEAKTGWKLGLLQNSWPSYEYNEKVFEGNWKFLQSYSSEHMNDKKAK